MEINGEYQRGYEDGIRALADNIKKYYEKLGSNTYGHLVAYTIDLKVKEMLEGSENHENNGGF